MRVRVAMVFPAESTSNSVPEEVSVMSVVLLRVRNAPHCVGPPKNAPALPTDHVGVIGPNAAVAGTT